MAVSDTVSCHYETCSQIGDHAEPRQLLIQRCTHLSVCVRSLAFSFSFFNKSLYPFHFCSLGKYSFHENATALTTSSQMLSGKGAHPGNSLLSATSAAATTSTDTCHQSEACQTTIKNETLLENPVILALSLAQRLCSQNRKYFFFRKPHALAVSLTPDI